MKHPKKQVAMSTQVKIIYAWLLIMLLKTGDALIVVMICQDCIIVNTVVKA